MAGLDQKLSARNRPGEGPGRGKAGRPKGTPNRATIERQRAIAESGLTPLDYMIAVMRDENQPPEMRLDAARSAAPYVHPRLAQTQVTGKDGGPVQIEDASRATLLAEIMSALRRPAEE